MNGILTASVCAASGGLQRLIELATSKYAIFAYIALLAGLLVCIILVCMRGDKTPPRVIATGNLSLSGNVQSTGGKSNILE